MIRVGRVGRVGASVIAGVGFALLVACGKDNQSEFLDLNDPYSEEVTTPPSFDPQSTKADGGGDTDGGNGDANATCATVKAEAKLTPVNMVVMYDQSGSMGDTIESPSYDPAKRWIPVGTAMKDFFTNAASAGMNASLTFFASATNSCRADDYGTPEVALMALPNAAFSSAIAAHAPKGDTPTRAAVKGAITQAQVVLAAHAGEKTVIVLVTDGEPYGCGIRNGTQSQAESTNVANDVAAVAATIPTYVIGVGPSVSNLNAVATAGGTTALQVTVGNPAQTTSDLLAAMATIRGQLASCDFAIPAPPDGRNLDFDKVFVERTPSGQPAATLPYNQTCSGPGWRYDDPKTPTKVLLCDATCNVVKADRGGKIDVQFACISRPASEIPPR